MALGCLSRSSLINNVSQVEKLDYFGSYQLSKSLFLMKESNDSFEKKNALLSSNFFLYNNVFHLFFYPDQKTSSIQQKEPISPEKTEQYFPSEIVPPAFQTI